MPSLDNILQPELNTLVAKHRLRARMLVAQEEGASVLRGDKQLISFASNDYFGLGREETSKAKSALLGAGASALAGGYHPQLKALEDAVAKYKHSEAALVFGSGYLANLGTISALADKGDLILADRLVHACMIDGAQLSGATLRRFRHNDLVHLQQLLLQRAEYRRCLILTETVFSMDGDRAPLSELAALAKAHDAWLMTDDAHGLGMVEDNPAAIQVGTLSKGLGAYGGYVCGSNVLIEYLVNYARSYIFSTALPPAICMAAHRALEKLTLDAELRLKPLLLARSFTAALNMSEAQSAIVPLIIGSDAAVLAASEALADAGFWVPAIRPPTVAEGTARLRFAFNALHQPQDIKRLVEVIKAHGWHENSYA